MNVAHLTDAQLGEWIPSLDEPTLRRWLGSLVRWIRDHEQDLAGRAAKVDHFIRRVNEGLRRLPERVSVEAQAQVSRVIDDAIARGDG